MSIDNTIHWSHDDIPCRQWRFWGQRSIGVNSDIVGTFIMVSRLSGGIQGSMIIPLRGRQM